MTHPLLIDLAAILPTRQLITDPETLAPRLFDARKRFNGQAMGLALPNSAAQAAEIIGRCHEHAVPVVPQAGNTSLVGGATPMNHQAMILGCDHLNTIREVSAVGYTLTAEAGCILDEIRAAAEEVGRLFPMWLGSSGSARLGGLIGTNAGGLQVQRYGNMRELVLGIEAIMPNGQLFDGLHPLRKRNVGLDLKQLFIGAEGTMGFVTAATLRLFPAEQGQATAMVAIDNIAQVLMLFEVCKTAAGEVLTAFEMINAAALQLVADHFPAINSPFKQIPPYAVLIALSGSETDSILVDRLQDVLEESGFIDTAIAQNRAQGKALWRLREHIPAAQTQQGASIKHDIALPISAIAEFMNCATVRVQQSLPMVQQVIFGHVGDGNLHYNLNLPTGHDIVELEMKANDLLFELACRFGGDISAEHGIGRLRKNAADRWHDPVERNLMRMIKRTLDPDCLFNPGVLI